MGQGRPRHQPTTPIPWTATDDEVLAEFATAIDCNTDGGMRHAGDGVITLYGPDGQQYEATLIRTA